jgi:Flp pilus assembly protein TadB
VSKERARRRAVRLAQQEKERAARARSTSRRQRRQATLRRLTPRRPGRTGRLFVRRSRTERAGIAVLAVASLVVVWLAVPDMALRLLLIAVLLLVAPAAVVIALGRRT